MNCPLYDEYSEVRGSVALDPTDLNMISTTGQSCGNFGIHARLPILKELYDLEQEGGCRGGCWEFLREPLFFWDFFQFFLGSVFRFFSGILFSIFSPTAFAFAFCFSFAFAFVLCFCFCFCFCFCICFCICFCFCFLLLHLLLLFLLHLLFAAASAFAFCFYFCFCFCFCPLLLLFAFCFCFCICFCICFCVCICLLLLLRLLRSALAIRACAAASGQLPQLCCLQWPGSNERELLQGDSFQHCASCSKDPVLLQVASFHSCAACSGQGLTRVCCCMRRASHSYAMKEVAILWAMQG